MNSKQAQKIWSQKDRFRQVAVLIRSVKKLTERALKPTELLGQKEKIRDNRKVIHRLPAAVIWEMWLGKESGEDATGKPGTLHCFIYRSIPLQPQSFAVAFLMASETGVPQNNRISKKIRQANNL